MIPMNRDACWSIYGLDGGQTANLLDGYYVVRCFCDRGTLAIILQDPSSPILKNEWNNISVGIQ